jgi:prevent-host-death family protein
MEDTMPKLKPIKPREDVRPLSEVRAQIAAVVEQVQDTHRPVILTQRGRSAAVLLDVETYQDLLEELELLRDIRVAEQELAAGKGVPHERARAELHRRLAH